MLLLLCAAVCVGVCAGVEVEVEVSGGVVRGVERESERGRVYNAFLAIPYAKPPVDRLRFMPPVPAEAWEGVLNATEPRPPCAQGALGITDGVEDCLNLYVYAPKDPSGSLPVVVWLHGGVFVVGGAASMRENLLMDRDIVLVVPQYRLGLLGYFHTPTGTSVGNMGALDQLVALGWVQDNIAAFGGDPGSVTLAGDCAGGASAVYHMLSPLSVGLFHRVISFSGAPLSPWAMYTYNHRFMLILANYVKCPAHDQKLTVKCFQEVTVDELLHPVQMLCEARDPLVGNHRLSPVVQDPEMTPPEALFLPDHPLATLTSGPPSPVPVLMSVTEGVGTHLVDMLLYDFIKYKMEEDEGFLTKLLPMLLKETHMKNYTEHEKEFQDFYFPGISWNDLDEMLPGLEQMLGDMQFRAGVLETASLLSQHSPTYMMKYKFTHGPSLFTHRHPDPATAPPLPKQAGHGDEVALILPDLLHDYTDEQKEAITKLLDIVENFVYGRAPREDWPQFKADTHSTLTFTENGNFETESFATPKRTAMLQNIHSYLHHDALKVVSGGSGSSSGSGGSGGGKDEL